MLALIEDPIPPAFFRVTAKLDPCSIVAKLSEPGGSRKIISGISGPAVSNVCPPLDFEPRITPSV